MFEASYVIHRALFRLPIPSPSSKHHQTPVAPWVSAQWETRSSLSCQEGLFYVAHRCGASLWRRVRDAHRCGKRIGLFSSKDLCIAKPRGAQLLHRGGPSGDVFSDVTVGDSHRRGRPAWSPTTAASSGFAAGAEVYAVENLTDTRRHADAGWDGKHRR